MKATEQKSLHIGMIHFKIGETDGVSLEMEKWKQVLETAGHIVFFCSGEAGNASSLKNCTIIQELAYHLPEIEKLNGATFSSLLPYKDEDQYRTKLYHWADLIQGKLDTWIEQNALDVLIVENIWSVGVHPSAAIAVNQVIVLHPRLSVLSHNHDFYWERVGKVSLTCKTAMEVADCFLPPHEQSYSHVVINSFAQKALLDRKGLESSVIPNVFDFSKEPWQIDVFNADFRAAFNLFADDIVILQATRIIPRKGIELALDVVAELTKKMAGYIGKNSYKDLPYSQTSRIVLVLAGSCKDDQSNYLDRLQNKAKILGVELLYLGNRIASERSETNGQKTYSLWDAYANADIVSYPSYWEGWGNQFLEAVRAKLPILLFEYPVFKKDIASFGFQTISLGDTFDFDEDGFAKVGEKRIQEACRQILSVLFDRQVRLNMVELNFRIARKHFSLDALSVSLKKYWEIWSKKKWSL
ncbi:glycosyltransferase family 4 protein [uncultured Sphaerochaeta sp.]|uniref:glycosyltransferase family 4 protein n=1 Tax=uncultured Sphaerochaeta sp. TaxID=886478 RepID=UPI002A0A37E8|nr:glycosyltransferase family 4 protein [uncultured Sphaerochaeta sp.]